MKQTLCKAVRFLLPSVVEMTEESVVEMTEKMGHFDKLNEPFFLVAEPVEANCPPLFCHFDDRREEKSGKCQMGRVSKSGSQE